MGKETMLEALVIGQKGGCAAGHKKGDMLEVSCMKPGGLCGFFYYSLFANLQTLEYGGKMPCWSDDALHATCPDPNNPVTRRITRKKA